MNSRDSNKDREREREKPLHLKCYFFPISLAVNCGISHNNHKISRQSLKPIGIHGAYKHLRNGVHNTLPKCTAQNIVQSNPIVDRFISNGEFKNKNKINRIKIKQKQKSKHLS